MLRVGPEIMALASPLWIAAGSAAFLVIIICVLAFRRSRKGVSAAAGRFVLVLFGAVLCGSLTWALFDSATVRDQTAERSALETRADGLTAQALMPGSPLACLDALAGDTVQAACQKAVFASPASVAAAISYVAAQFVLLSDMTDYKRRGGAGIDIALLPLRRALEADPFGFLAHVLVMRDGCTSENCPALRLLRDPSHVRTNLIALTLDHYVDHYREAWARSPDVPVADLTDAQPTGTADGNAPGTHKVVVDIDFPSAASIPPISIMNPEPKGPAVARAAGAAANPEPARKRTGKPPAHEGAQGGAASPPDGARTDPVWTPAPAPAAQ